LDTATNFNKKDNLETNRDASETAVINGSIESIIFQNPDNDFTVAKIIAELDKDLFTAVGHLGGVHPGENIQLSGKWINDPRFGKQLKIKKFRIIMPSTEKGIIKFLSSGLIYGIGKSFATKIVDTFGKETLNIISEQPHRLTEVKGLGEKRIQGLLKSWKEHYAIRDIMMFLQNFEISSAFASKIFRQYGFDSIEKVKSNPYRLAGDISGIGFLSADHIASSMGIEKDSNLRIEAGIVYVLEKLTDAGHIYLPLRSLISEALKILDTSNELLEENIGILLKKEMLLEKTDTNNEPIIYLRALYDAEEGVAHHIRRIISHEKNFCIINQKKEMEIASTKTHITFSNKQKSAIEMTLKEKMIVITGGPGTGKTTIIKTVVNIFDKYNLKLNLAAPTGRAAKRLSESTTFEAKTIHRLLEFNPRLNHFEKNGNNHLDVDVIIIDEASMIDLILMYHLVNAIPDHAVFILVGDVDQLPSVGPGKVLKDIINSKAVVSVRLDNVYRQETGSNITDIAHQINNGKQITVNNDKNDSFFFIQKNDNTKIPEMITELVSKRIPAKFGLDPLLQIQVLTPMHKTETGVISLNEKLQATLNKNERVSVRRHLSIAIDDKVMQTSNNYDKNIFNGDIGFVKFIDKQNQRAVISFDEKNVEFNFNELDDLVLAYAITIHKSQGSEYDAVVIPITTQHYTMLQRNLIYTAITRGKKLVILIGSMKALNIAIRNNRIQNRFSNLEEKLRHDN